MEALGLQIEVITPAQSFVFGNKWVSCGEVLNIYQFALSQVHGKRLVLFVLFSSRPLSILSCLIREFIVERLV